MRGGAGMLVQGNSNPWQWWRACVRAGAATPASGQNPRVRVIVAQHNGSESHVAVWILIESHCFIYIVNYMKKEKMYSDRSLHPPRRPLENGFVP